MACCFRSLKHAQKVQTPGFARIQPLFVRWIALARTLLNGNVIHPF
jgi:hypothetical protein